MGVPTEEGWELAEKNPGGRGHVGGEQEQRRLLGAWDGDGDGDGDNGEGEDNCEDERSDDKMSRRHNRLARWKYAVLIPAVVVLVVSLVLMAGLLFRPKLFKEGGAIPILASKIETNDYLLDPYINKQIKGQRREHFWTIRDHMHNPDGVYRPMILINNQFPGPMIEVNEGDTIIVHVDNQAANATSIHWHGIYQNGTPYMDGTVGVTQCPIAPGSQFTYEFKISGQGGTYWWHAHQGVQSSDGLHGPLIIHSPRDQEQQRYEYGTDRVLLVSDHYHDLSSALLWQYLKPDMENAEPVPNSALINGRGKVNCDDFPDRKCTNTSSHVGFPIITLDPLTRHRLRLINVGAFAEFQIQVDEHMLEVVEVDGTDVAPASFHRVNINPAQRYSVVVNPNRNGSDYQFWLRARMITRCFTDPPRTIQSEASAVVRYYEDAIYDGMPISDDWETQLDLECKDMNTTELMPVEKIAPPAEPDAFFYLRSNFEIGAYRLSRGFFNSSSWRPNIRSPSLLRTIDGLVAGNVSLQSAQGISPIADSVFINSAAFDASRELVLQTTGSQTIDILVSNFDDGDHPLHLHGYKYFVLAQGHGYPALTEVGAAITRENLQPLYGSLDLENPLRRDTAAVEAYGWMLIRFVADNPGAWAFHCHVTWHSEAGLLMQFVTNTDGLRNMTVPTANRKLCAAAGLEKGKGPEDEDYRSFAR